MNYDHISDVIKSLGIHPEDEHFEIADAIIRECISLCNEIGEDVDNGNVFIHNRTRLDDYKLRFSTGPYECSESISKKFGIRL